MTRLVKIIDNKYVQIEEYRNPNICFNTNEYSDFEDYCTLRETFDPFEMFYENQELKKQLEVSNELVAQGTLTEMKLRNEFNRWRKEYQDTYKDVRIEIKEYKTQQKEFIKYLEDEKDRLAKICNNLGENKFDEADDILQKYKEIIGDDK